jgi:glutamyl-tRNA reductase
LHELTSELGMADVAICSTSSDRFVITPELMKEVGRARKFRTLFLIDIAVPRDVDPRVGEMENVFLYDVDDLQKVASQNLNTRQKEADLAERIVEHEVGEFETWRKQQHLKPLIVALRQQVRGVLQQELERTLPKLAADGHSHQEALERMLDAATNKLLHPTLAEVKRAAEAGDLKTLRAVEVLYGLSKPSE